MITLLEKQHIFVRLIAQLIQEANRCGYELAFGEAERSPAEAHRLAEMGKGINNSLHTIKLAVDFDLFKDKKYLDKTEDHKFLGIYWESLSTEQYKCSWGGHFGDGNHYSIEHGGVK